MPAIKVKKEVSHSTPTFPLYFTTKGKRSGEERKFNLSFSGVDTKLKVPSEMLHLHWLEEPR